MTEEQPTQTQEKREWVAFEDEAPTHIKQALREIMRLLEPIAKDREVNMPGARYSYRGIEDVLNTFHDLLAEYGVLCTPELIGEPLVTPMEIQRSNKPPTTYIHMTCRYKFHLESMVDESKLTIGPVVGEGYDGQDKASNKALSNAMKIAFFVEFCIPTVDMLDSEASDKGRNAESRAPQNTQRPPSPASDKDPEHRKELREKLLALAGKDPTNAQQMLVEYSKFVGDTGQEVFIAHMDDTRLKGRWLNKILARAREEYANMTAAEGSQTSEGDGMAW